MVLGTPAYMSPEQVRGEPADHRADIFAFGCVFYEMLGSKPAFRRDTPIESMNAVLKEEMPNLAAINASVPPALERIVRRCLEKQPENRLQSAKDLAFAIEDAGTTARIGWHNAKVPARLGGGALVPWALVVVCAAGLGAVLLFRREGAGAKSEVVQPRLLRKFDLTIPHSTRQPSDPEPVPRPFAGWKEVRLREHGRALVALVGSTDTTGASGPGPESFPAVLVSAEHGPWLLRWPKVVPRTP